MSTPNDTVLCPLKAGTIKEGRLRMPHQGDIGTQALHKGRGWDLHNHLDVEGAVFLELDHG
jgi:hypothetical protein